MKYYIMDYQNGNKRIDLADIIRREEKEFILTECYTPQELNEIKAELETETAFNEWLEKKINENLSQYIVGIVEAEHEPTWDDLEYDETGGYHLKDDIAE